MCLSLKAEMWLGMYRSMESGILMGGTDPDEGNRGESKRCPMIANHIRAWGGRLRLLLENEVGGKGENGCGLGFGFNSGDFESDGNSTTFCQECCVVVRDGSHSVYAH